MAKPLTDVFDDDEFAPEKARRHRREEAEDQGDLADPSRRRPRLIQRTPGPVIVAVARWRRCGVCRGGFGRMDRQAGPTLGGAGRSSWLTATRRRRASAPLLGSVIAAGLIGLGVAALATWDISGRIFHRPACKSNGY